jgi:hypothetical protein
MFVSQEIFTDNVLSFIGEKKISHDNHLVVVLFILVLFDLLFTELLHYSGGLGYLLNKCLSCQVLEVLWEPPLDRKPILLSYKEALSLRFGSINVARSSVECHLKHANNGAFKPPDLKEFNFVDFVP